MPSHTIRTSLLRQPRRVVAGPVVDDDDTSVQAERVEHLSQPLERPHNARSLVVGRDDDGHGRSLGSTRHTTPTPENLGYYTTILSATVSH